VAIAFGALTLRTPVTAKVPAPKSTKDPTACT
jgi:hypothetical protein